MNETDPFVAAIIAMSLVVMVCAAAFVMWLSARVLQIIEVAERVAQ